MCYKIFNFLKLNKIIFLRKKNNTFTTTATQIDEKMSLSITFNQQCHFDFFFCRCYVFDIYCHKYEKEINRRMKKIHA